MYGRSSHQRCFLVPAHARENGDSGRSVSTAPPAQPNGGHSKAPEASGAWVTPRSWHTTRSRACASILVYPDWQGVLRRQSWAGRAFVCVGKGVVAVLRLGAFQRSLWKEVSRASELGGPSVVGNQKRVRVRVDAVLHESTELSVHRTSDLCSRAQAWRSSTRRQRRLARATYPSAAAGTGESGRAAVADGGPPTNRTRGTTRRRC